MSRQNTIYRTESVSWDCEFGIEGHMNWIRLEIGEVHMGEEGKMNKNEDFGEGGGYFGKTSIHGLVSQCF